MDESIEALVNGLPDHLSSWDELGIKLVKDVFEVVSLHIFLRIEQLEELLNELGSNIGLKALHITGFVDNQLKEELVDALQMGPRGVDFLLLLDTGLRERKARALLDVR